MKKVRNIMTKEPKCCSPETDLGTVARAMCDFDCGEIPVVDQENRLMGVITDRDITCRIVAQGKNPLGLKAQDCMTSSCVTVSTETTLDECCAVMGEYQVRRVPVVDQDGRCCGIVAQADIVLTAPNEKIVEVLQEVSKGA